MKWNYFVSEVFLNSLSRSWEHHLHGTPPFFAETFLANSLYRTWGGIIFMEWSGVPRQIFGEHGRWQQQNSGKSGKFRFDDWYFAAFPAEYECIKFYMPTGPESLLFPDTVMIHPSGLLLCGQNKYVRHWLDVFLRHKLPPRVVVNPTHDQEFLLHMHVSQWNRTFTVKQNQFDWVEPPQPSRKTTLPSSFEKKRCHHPIKCLLQ